MHVQGMCEQRILNGPEALQLLLHGEGEYYLYALLKCCAVCS